MHSDKYYEDILFNINKTVKRDFDGHCQVMSGVLSDALYFFKYALHFKDEESMDRAYEIVNYHIETATDHLLNYKFAHGLPGISWMVSFLNNQGLIDKELLIHFKEIDLAIEKSLEWDFADHTYDLTVGMIGKGQYFFERGLTADNTKIISNIIDQLELQAVFFNSGSCAWLDHYTSLHNKDERKIGPYYNLGLGHGLSSVVYFLCKCYKAGIQREKTEKLINSSLNWLYEQEDLAHYPYILENIKYSGEQTGTYQSRIQGWCQGLISNGFSFLIAGRTLGSSDYLKKFDEILSASTKIRSEEKLFDGKEFKLTNDSVLDLSFCHGLTGLIFLYDRLYFLTQNSDCMTMSNYWSEIMFKDVLSNIPLGEFYNHGILGGLPGLGMTILQKLDLGKSSFGWEKAFLLDLENF